MVKRLLTIFTPATPFAICSAFNLSSGALTAPESVTTLSATSIFTLEFFNPASAASTHLCEKVAPRKTLALLN
jgi:hypothetical protein